jgi:hypothetical protein
MLRKYKQLDYKSKPGFHPYVNQNLFGRINSRIAKGETRKYYVKGIFHDIPHCKINKNRILFDPSCNPDFETVERYTDEIIVTEVEKDSDDIFLRTGHQRFKFFAKENEYDVYWTDE